MRRFPEIYGGFGCFRELQAAEGTVHRLQLPNLYAHGFAVRAVYGLAADALNGKAVSKIFKAKGRPGDNPLIVHVAAFEDIEKYNLVKKIPQGAKILADKYWPGPLTNQPPHL